MIIELIVGIATVLAIIAIGNLVLKKVWVQDEAKINKEKNKESLPWFEVIPLSTGLGLIMLAAYAFVLNLAGLGYWYLLFLPLIAAIPFWIMQIKPTVEKFKALKKRISASSIELRAGVGLIALLFVVGFLIALAPPSASRPGPIDWDSLNYHLVIPKTYLSQHSLASIPFLAYDNWPHSLETFYTIPMSLAGSQAAKLVMLFTALAMALALFALARKFVKTEQAIIAPLVFLTNFVAIFSLGTGYVDIALAFFVMLSLICMHSWLAGAGKNWQLLALAGAFAGFAASVKLIGLIPLVLVGLIALYYTVRKNKVKQTIPFSLMGLIFIAPWLLRTYLNYGNPIYPLFYAPLGWVGISSAGTEYFMSIWQSGALASGAGRGVIDFFLLPVTLTFQGKLYNGIISPLYLALAPLLLISLHKISEFEKPLVVFALFFAIPWFLLYQDMRFFEPVLAITAVLFTLALSRFPAVEVYARRAVLAVVFIALAIFALYGAKAFPVAVGMETGQSYLNRTLDTYAPCQYINSNPEIRQVLFYKVEKAYYCNKPFAYSNFYNATAAGKAELVNQLRRDGFTHILYNPLESATSGIRELISSSQPIYTANGLAIYSIP